MTTEKKLERIAIVNPYGEYAIPVSKLPLLMDALSHMIRIDRDYDSKKWSQATDASFYVKYLCAADATALMFDTGIMSVVDVAADVEAEAK